MLSNCFNLDSSFSWLIMLSCMTIWTIFVKKVLRSVFTCRTSQHKTWVQSAIFVVCGLAKFGIKPNIYQFLWHFLLTIYVSLHSLFVSSYILYLFLLVFFSLKTQCLRSKFNQSIQFYLSISFCWPVQIEMRILICSILI